MDKEGIIKSKGIYTIVKASREGKPVILKGLKKEWRDKSQFHTLLKKEYDRCHPFDHPNIVKYIDFTTTDDYGPCIVEEYVDGRSLSDYLKEDHSVDEKLAILHQICDALGYLHETNTMHRNLKASNILVSRSGDQVKVIDMRPPFADDLHVGYSSMVHIAPEQKDGTVAIDGRADIFSLGVVMKDFDLPDQYSPIIEKCTSFSRGDRYMDAAEVAEALDSAGTVVSSRKPWIIGIIAVVMVIVAVLLFGRHSVSDGQQANDSIATEQPQQEAAQPVMPQTSESAQPAAQSRQAQSATASPSDGVAQGADLTFLNNAKEQMYKDIDNMFAPYLTGQKTNRKALNRQVTKYYRGLLRTFGKIDDAQRAAYDKTFGDYVAQKRRQLPVGQEAAAQ